MHGRACRWLLAPNWSLCSTQEVELLGVMVLYRALIMKPWEFKLVDVKKGMHQELLK